MQLQRTDVHNSDSTDAWVRLCDSAPLRGALGYVRMELEWKDQGWGNQKGLVRASHVAPRAA